MGFCPYCKQIVGDNVTECPSCGMSWAGTSQPQVTDAPPAPRITGEQPYQPPPQQYQQPPPQQYQQPPQPQYQQPPPQQYQQPPPQQYQQQPQYQQPPPQQYQQPPPQYQQPRPRVLVGGGSMIAAIFGGIGALLASFMFYLVVDMNGVDYIQLWDYLDFMPDAFLYLWMIPVGGLLALLFAIIGYAAQSKGLAYLVGILGILLLLLPVLFAAHAVAEYDAEFVDIFYTSLDTAVNQTQFTLFLGGFMCIFAGLMITIAGFGMAGKIGRQQRSHPPQQYYR